jgi:hypothetical protein
MGIAAGESGSRRRSDPHQRAATGTVEGGPARALDVLFVMRSLNYLRFFRSSLELLVERGHTVRLLLERGDHGEVEQAWLDRMREHPGFDCEIADHFGPKLRRARLAAVRRGIEYVRVLHSEVDRSTVHFRHRLRDAPPSVLRLTEAPLLRTRAGLRALHGLLSAADRALASPVAAAEYVGALRPDVVALSDHGNVGSLHSEYAKAAKELGIPVAVCVATWDNLSSRQRLRVIPDQVVVWNRRQLQEAVEIHGVPAGRVVVTGAPNFDDWFSWEPRPREEFLAGVGLDPARPVVLWVGGALYKAERTEAEYALEWLAALRSSSDPVLRGAGVLLRPHPRRLKQWLGIDVSDVENAVVWPTENVTMPVDAGRKADYFDSIYHAAAVVGLNTSAMIEASIVGRPVLTVLEPGFHDSQQGTFHFPYLLESSGGPVRVARSRDEQFAQLGEILASGDEEAAERSRRFVGEFVRPHGLARPATPIFVDTLERLAGTPVRPEADPVWVRAARGPVLGGLWLYDRAPRPPRGLGRLRRAPRRLVAAVRARRPVR